MEWKRYIQSYNDYFWEWEDGGDVLTIPNESTIAYRAFIVDMIGKLAPNGLPHFGPLLLATIATNQNGSASIDCIYSLLKGRLNNTEIAVLDDAFAFLKILSELPRQYKEGKKRVLLFQAIFDRCHNQLSAKNSVRIYEHILANKDWNSTTIKKDFDSYVFHNDFKVIGLLGNKFADANSIINRIASLPDIDEEIQLTEDETPDVNTEKDFINTLIDNNKTFHIGSLIRHIWGGLNIPAHSSVPSQQSTGGVSDLTNKGDFDKLLISEFANEDLIFLSRLANNEALYIRREVPPMQNDLRRIILIDVSLKNWGTPKTLAFAIALAIARHPKTQIPCSVFALGDTCYPLSIADIDGIIDGQQVVDGSLHCASGLAAYFKANPANNNNEVFLITERTTVKNAALLRSINEQNNISYTIYTDADGTIDVYKKQQNSKRHLQHLQIPLNVLWEKRKNDFAEQQTLNSLYPILFRNGTKERRLLLTSDGAIFQVTNDNVLLKLPNRSFMNSKGWEMLLENLSFSTCEFEMGLLKNGEYLFLVFDRKLDKIILTNLTTGKKTEHIFKEWQPTTELSFVFHNDCFYHRNKSRCWEINSNGDIKSISAIADNIFSERKKEISGLAKKLNRGTSIFKNIEKVFINQAGNLVFNIHELILKQNHYLLLEKTSFLQKKYDSVREGENQFVFSDGSVIELNRAGLLILKSSDTTIPHIYVSSVLYANVGIATDNVFAGNEYYNRSLSTISVTEFYRRYLGKFITQIETGTK